MRIVLFAALVGFGALSLSPDAQAQSSSEPPTACDPEYMDALEARAWLEMQRELLQNQNLIAKPDSVLEYSCFANELWRLANYNNDNADPNTWLFSEGGCCNTPNTNAVALDTVIGGIVYDATLAWIQSHFWFNETNDDALGGRSWGTTTNDTWSPSFGGGKPICSNMSAIWDFAHCSYFSDSNPFDGFYDFAHYAGQDPRTLPELPSGEYCPTRSTYTAMASEDVRKIFGEQQPVAFNDKQQYYVLATENPNAGSAGSPTDKQTYKNDPVQTHLNLILPVGTDPAPQSCSEVKPIRTGVCVTRVQNSQQVTYADAVCPNPGCHYKSNPGSCESVGTCQ